MTNTQKFQAGQVVYASDGMSPWEPARIISGPFEQLTTDYPLYLIEFLEDESNMLAHESDLRSGTVTGRWSMTS